MSGTDLESGTNLENGLGMFGETATPNFDLSPTIDFLGKYNLGGQQANQPSSLNFGQNSYTGTYGQNSYLNNPNNSLGNGSYYDQVLRQQATPPPTPQPTPQQGFFGDMSGAQIANAGFGALQSLVGMYQGFQSSKMAKKQFNLQREQWDKQWTAQTKMTNGRLEDKYRARLNGAGSGAANMESKEDYMKRRGV